MRPTRFSILARCVPFGFALAWAYDRQSSIGRLDKGLDEALAKGWTVADMKKDWKRVFPFEK